MLQDLISLFYPRLCVLCDDELLKREQIICVTCAHELPVTNYLSLNENPVKKVFYGRLLLENATALLLFQKKGSVQKLIHQLKYRGYKEISSYLGKWMGKELSSFSSYAEIDIVIPVPLHRKKLKTRGFNQVEGFGTEIARALEIPYLDNVLLKKSFTRTQTLKGRLARWGEIQETFVLEHPELVHGKHILLVDDLLTTGATLEACANILQQAGDVKISIATMAITD